MRYRTPATERLEVGLVSLQAAKTLMWFTLTGPCTEEQPPFPKGQTALRGSASAPGRRQGATGTTVRRV